MRCAFLRSCRSWPFVQNSTKR